MYYFYRSSDRGDTRYIVAFCDGNGPGKPLRIAPTIEEAIDLVHYLHGGELREGYDCASKRIKAEKGETEQMKRAREAMTDRHSFIPAERINPIIGG